MEQDESHLDLLAIFHYVVAGLTGLFSLFPMIHVIIGWFLAHSEADFIGWFFMAIGGTLVVIGMTFAGSSSPADASIVASITGSCS